ncbi:hypothetical protein ECP02999175_1653 [Escherichia coli P0299917.5]|nr:hypothetical protein ECP029991710_1591 [Escherichia coli P0299917.10]ENC47958.1 hypothetical protein ECP02999172_1682 [Escherichia coli P0299917.2]ENC57502.1 hypothetical protein ECP02999174_1579 [Escherichia coli P0299917.4]ENC60537.1 hypothetical protein ECP02999173_1555 [Escherichia coli P0299917.3]ENC62568.1 hypothetical protein ECP02999175_1653 [Escherichia coli P0299917.5]ENC73592.1 hypothetical protein ECP02999178_1629 [Escherichia coli P0299917.8]ENC73974.1 hypothetical protein ECP
MFFTCQMELPVQNVFRWRDIYAGFSPAFLCLNLINLFL